MCAASGHRAGTAVRRLRGRARPRAAAACSALAPLLLFPLSPSLFSAGVHAAIAGSRREGLSFLSPPPSYSTRQARVFYLLPERERVPLFFRQGQTRRELSLMKLLYNARPIARDCAPTERRYLALSLSLYFFLLLSWSMDFLCCSCLDLGWCMVDA